MDKDTVSKRSYGPKKRKQQAVKHQRGISLAVQWLGLHTPTAGDMGSIPGQGTKILHAALCGQLLTPPKTNKQTSERKQKECDFWELSFRDSAPLSPPSPTPHSPCV